MFDPRARLSALWIFAMANYLYCDIVGLMDAGQLRQYLTGTVNGMVMSQGFLLGASVLMEIPAAMIVASRVLPHRTNRWANVAAGAVMTLVQAATLLVGAPSPYYLFFSVVEIGATMAVIAVAWSWRPEGAGSPAAVPGAAEAAR